MARDTRGLARDTRGMARDTRVDGRDPRGDGRDLPSRPPLPGRKQRGSFGQSAQAVKFSDVAWRESDRVPTFR